MAEEIEKQINERIIRFTGSATINKDFELGEEVTFTEVVGGVVKIEEGDNQDGTKDRTFKIKLIRLENGGLKK